MEWSKDDTEKLNVLFAYVCERFTMWVAGSTDVADFLVECVKNGPLAEGSGPAHYPNLEDKGAATSFGNKVMKIFMESVRENRCPTGYIVSRNEDKCATSQATRIYEDHGVSMMFLRQK